VLRHDAFKAELAGMLEHGGSLLFPQKRTFVSAVRDVPGADQALSHLDLLGHKSAWMSAPKSAPGAVKSIPDVATLILATLIGTVGCRRIHLS
jgi:hypothetical protein